ncbi:DUF3563 domain-containing protein [bacterium]|jgi:uncharacterized protein YeeX (DUF496 family)|nr:DUF3563 domain-containing protein [bacterium]
MGRNMHNKVQEKLKEIKEWLESTLRSDYYADVEDYLAQSTDIYDLERRMRNLQHRGHAI